MHILHKLAWRNLIRNPRRSLLTGLIISCSTAALIVTDAFILGFSDAATRSATQLFSGDAQIHHREYLAAQDEVFTIDPQSVLLQPLNQHPDIRAYSPRVLAFGMISSAADNRAAQIVGVDPEAERHVSKLAQGMIEGAFLDLDGSTQQMVIGHRLARRLDVGLGDRIVVSVHHQQRNEVEQALFRVSGVFNLNARPLDEELVVVLAPVLQQMQGIGTEVHQISILFHEPTLARDLTAPIWSALSDDQVVIQSWLVFMPQLAAMLDMLSVSLWIIGGLLFILAALGVVNGIFMSIYERLWELGVLIAIGTRRRRIVAMVLLENLWLAVVAITVGLCLGALATLMLAWLGIDYGTLEIADVAVAEQIRPRMSVHQYLLYPPLILALSLLAASYPAVYAARLMPSRAMRKSL